MEPSGNFISEYIVYSINENVDIILEAQFTGISDIKKVSELISSSKVLMTRKSYIQHLNLDKNHFYTIEEYLEILNDPDLVLLGRVTGEGHQVQFLIKKKDLNRTAIVIIYTSKFDQKHYIASGFIVSNQRFNMYKHRHKVLWEKAE